MISKSSQELQLAEIRRLNALDLARYQGGVAVEKKPPACATGCACQFAKALAFHIVSQDDLASTEEH